MWECKIGVFTVYMYT